MAEIADTLYQKGRDNVGSPIAIGTNFSNVFSDDANNKISLADFYKSYKEFLTDGKFIYYGSDEPSNKDHIVLWIQPTA